MTVQPQKYLFTVDEYYRMAEAGIFSQDDRVELIEGEIVEMTPIGSTHAGRVDCIAQLFFQQVQAKAIVRVQNPVRLSRHSEPQPDLALLKPRSDFYTTGHPGPEDMLLVEVADTSQEYDRRTRVPLYARAGIAEVWLVDLTAETLEIYRDPSAQGYRQIQTVKRGHPISCQSLAEVRLPVDDILG